MMLLLLLLSLLLLFCVQCKNYTYKVLLDAGSTGTRVYIYTYDEDHPTGTIDEIAREKSNNPLSSFINNKVGLNEQISSLVDFAKISVPQQEWSRTNISLKATAGLRSLSILDQEWLISQVISILENSNFLFYKSDTKVLSGTEEAIYDFLAIKILLEKNKIVTPFVSIGAADLGGSSQQIAFAYNNNSMRNEQICLPDWLLGSNEIVAKSLKKRGLIAAMDEVISTFYSNSCNNSNNNNNNNDDEMMHHPCLLPGMTDYFENDKEPLYGSGDFDKCVQIIQNTLLVEVDFNPKCLHNHANSPYMIIGMDNFPKVLEVLKLTGNGILSPQEIAVEGRIACSRSFTELSNDFPSFKVYRLQRACFGAAYVYSMLTDVYGLNPQDKAFMAIESLGNIELSWSLGAAIVGTPDLIPTQLRWD